MTDEGRGPKISHDQAFSSIAINIPNGDSAGAHTNGDGIHWLKIIEGGGSKDLKKKKPPLAPLHFDQSHRSSVKIYKI